MKALIIFARYPEPGKVKTRLGRVIGMTEAAMLYRAFATHAFSIGEAMRQSGVTVYLFFPPEATEEVMRAWVGLPFRYRVQEGNDLGERMSNAFSSVFDDGATAVAIIGTDVPELKESTVRQAFAILETKEIAVGPCSDGGYYLIGMKRPIASLFTEIDWSTEDVLRSTLQRIADLRLSHGELKTHDDIDTIEDYEAYRARLQAIP